MPIGSWWRCLSVQSRRPDVLKYLEKYGKVARRVKEVVLRHDPSA